MSALKFCANISWLFTELPEFSQRAQAAARAGFQAVEAAWLYDSDPGELRSVAERTGLEVALINTPPGDLKNGDLGLGAVPGREQDFRQGLDQAVQYAKILNCKRIHLMAGRVPTGTARPAIAVEMEATFVQNLKYAADILAKVIQNLTLQSFKSHEAVEVAECAPDSRHLFLPPPVQDVYHWQIMDGNLTQNLQKYFPLIGHVQVAQVPDRHEPDSPGEVNFLYLFNLLEKLGYQGYVGCEYKPAGSTEAGLGWVRKYWEGKK
uniref:Putative hydroxypyruvate isomerase n=1 Tax=Astyanax mexicanus TaxID=7994 RepID=A0A8B9LKL2_ASTMX